MFEIRTTLVIAGVEVAVQKRAGESAYDITVPTEIMESGGYTLTFFPDLPTTEEDVFKRVTADIEAALS